eukprot:2282921-Alexandrium_andersonii.AAC.1
MQWSLGSSLGHLQNCLKVAAHGREAKRGPALGQVYDRLARQRWARCAAGGECDFDINETAAE